ncbi:unnamed protein product [Caenorhabditis sp. 36 PRJEB53466]|nr:unnamed protein product [Caenorhabditis sp. 36 PRJEB53466]
MQPCDNFFCCLSNLPDVLASLPEDSHSRLGSLPPIQPYMRVFVLLIFSLVSSVFGFKTNRTSCFHYISCLEAIQSNLKQCAGGAAISLTLEAKDVNIRDLVKYRALEFVGCQDRLLKETVDFEALQMLVNEDARECFEKLPESSKRVEPFTDSCDYVQPVSRNSSKGDALQCLIEFKQDREYCESLLECCPDHTRCGERMNAVSLSYQNARVKAEQIVYSMISCVVVNDPRFLREGARLQSLRDPYRNSGVPFLRPDAYTEARITRRLALTSTSTLSQRRERFLKKYTQIRQLVTENLFGQQEAKSIMPVEDVVTGTSSKMLEPEKQTEDSIVENQKNDDEKTSTQKPEISETTAAPAQSFEEPQLSENKSSEMNVKTIRNLIKNASDRDLSKYVTLISEGKFSDLFDLANTKTTSAPKLDNKLSAKMFKLKELITEALSEKSSETEKPSENIDKIEKLAELEEMKKTDVIRESNNPAVFTILEHDQQIGDKNTKFVDRTSRNVAAAENEEIKTDVKIASETISSEKTVNTESIADLKALSEPRKESHLEKVEPLRTDATHLLKEQERALLVESEIKDSAVKSKNLVEDSLKSEETTLVADDLPVLDKEESGEKKEVASETTLAISSTTTSKPELLSSSDDVLTVTVSVNEDVEGSGQEAEAAATTATAATLEHRSELIENVKRIRPRTEQTHCQQYASCWQTVIDYEQQCDQKYSTDVLSHGIDDSEILNILHNSSISHHEIVLKACLRPLDRSVHSTLKQLFVIQRGVRKACLELGRNKIAVTDAEEKQCNTEIPSTAFVDEFISSVHARSQANHLTCRAKLEPIREACHIVRNCCASVETCDNYISSSPVKKLETEAIRRLVKRQNDCETKMLQTLSYIHEQLSNPSRRRRFYYH